MYNTHNQYDLSLVNSLFPSFVRSMPRTTMAYSTVQPATGVLSGPGAPVAPWSIMFSRWEPLVYLMGGTLAMKQAGQKYLPQEEGEEDGIYLNRLTRSVLYGAYSRTIKTLSDMPFMTAMSVIGLPEELDYLLKDADGEDQTLEEFAKQLVIDSFMYGKFHILVEYPNTEGEELSKTDEEKRNIKPYLCRVDPMRLIGWKTERVGCKTVLTEIRIFEDVTETDEDNPWVDRHKQQVRVIEPGLVSVYDLQEGEDGQKKYELAYDPVETSLSRMNLVTGYSNRTGFMTSAPVLEELGWLNIRHWQKMSDLDNIEHVINVPMAYAFGLKEGEFDNVVFSPHSMLKSGNENLKVGYLEHSGQAIPASQVSVKMLEDRMIAMGAEALAPRGTSTRETGIAKTIDNTKATSILQSIVESVEDGLEKALVMAGEWIDKDLEDVQVNIGDKISMTVDANLIPNLIELAKNNNMSFEDLTKELQTKKLILASTELKSGNEELVTKQMEQQIETEGQETQSNGSDEAED